MGFFLYLCGMIKSIDTYFKSLGFEIDDIQGDDPSVGIPIGWVIFKDTEPNSKWMVIDFPLAQYCTWELKTKDYILDNSEIELSLED